MPQVVGNAVVQATVQPALQQGTVRHTQAKPQFLVSLRFSLFASKLAVKGVKPLFHEKALPPHAKPA